MHDDNHLKIYISVQWTTYVVDRGSSIISGFGGLGVACCL